ncbi:coiled-coil domain-containing protein 69 [Eucyclogobius newberryi]|uniref:coiled-coil domain-containing protein 69 n=1 Tax=Eucyclogobius newberryi TaxID=166745 RepID=UPI003B58DF0F
MGCSHSKKQSKGKKKKEKRPSGDADPECDTYLCLEKQLEKFEWQLRTLKEVVSANGNAARAELLKGHAHEEVCTLVNNILDQVKTETTADLNVLLEQKSTAASEEHKRQVEELQNTHKQEITRLTEKFEAAESLLKVQVEELTSELQVYNKLKKRVQESTLKRELKRNIQAHGSPGAFWESEQESLLFVIEMKVNQVEEHKRRLQQMNQLTQKNLSLEEQVVQVLQQNEDLRVRLDNCQSIIQQLSKEQTELKLALEQQLSQNQRLSQEKEQLVFKIRHRDSYPSMHLSTMVAEMAPR